MLRDITVLDLATVGPAARASRWLADYGARVVKVSSTHRNQIVPPFYAYSAHRGMERVELDLSTPEGIETFMGMVENADVVIESFRPGVMARMGLGYDEVKARNPRIVFCSTTGYGQDGPRAQWAGHDLNYLAVAGFLDCSGRGPDGRPPIPGATVADSAGGGMNAVMGVLAALVRRATTGEGTWLDVSAADGVLALMALQVDEHLATAVVPGPGHGILTGRYACYGVYGCSDGKWLTVAAIEPKFWANLCSLLGLEKWTDAQLDDAVQDEIRADLEAAFRTRARDEWCAELAPADTCVAPVLSVPEVVADEQFTARNAFVWATDEEHGDFRQVGWVLAGSGVDA
jgi:alpha-methylacyl-CoA racemase